MSDLPTFRIPRVETHTIVSQSVGCPFHISIMQPLMRIGENARFPVLYVSDGNLIFDAAKSIAMSLQASGAVRRFILVGIGYPGDNPFVGDLLRARDFTWDDYPKIPVPASSPIEGVTSIEPGKPSWNGAEKFIHFLRDELFPLVESHYPTVSSDRGFYGHSGGGGFGLHVLLSERQLFDRYVISSPGISYGSNEFMMDAAKKVADSLCEVPVKLAMTVGELEEFEPSLKEWKLVSSFYRLAACLDRVRGLELKTRVFPNETHASAWPYAFSFGVRSIYGGATSPLLGPKES